MEIDVRHAEYKELEEVNRLREMVNELHVNGRPRCMYKIGISTE